MNDLNPGDESVIVNRCLNDPVFHIEHVQGIDTLEEYHKRIAMAVAKYSRVAISACHDLGKTYIMAKIVLWFQSCHPGAICITTAPTARQVNHLLWAEIRKGFKGSRYPLGGRMLKTPYWKIDEDWYALGFSPETSASDGKTQGTDSAFQGFHGRYVLIVFDEATGIKPPIWMQAEGMLTSGNVKFVVIGNPTAKNSNFYQCFKKRMWHKINLSCFDSPNFVSNGIRDLDELRTEVDLVSSMDEAEAQERIVSYKVVQPYLLTLGWAVQMAVDEWGIDHPLFQSKVLGQFPDEDENVMFPLGLVEQANSRDYKVDSQDARYIGVDPARFGSDKTVITVIEGWKVVLRDEISQKSTTFVSGRVTELVNSFARRERDLVLVDGTGIGAGVVDQLRQNKDIGVIDKGVYIYECHFGASSKDPLAPSREQEYDEKHFFNWKAKAFQKLKKDLQGKLDLGGHGVYEKELPTIIYGFDSKGRIKIESKDEYKKRTGRPSPDSSDSIALANMGRHVTIPVETDGPGVMFL